MGYCFCPQLYIRDTFLSGESVKKTQCVIESAAGTKTAGILHGYKTFQIRCKHAGVFPVLIHKIHRLIDCKNYHPLVAHLAYNVSMN